jgi:hypothetical protein
MNCGQPILLFPNWEVQAESETAPPAVPKKGRIEDLWKVVADKYEPDTKNTHPE